jgi:hypothetical protein
VERLRVLGVVLSIYLVPGYAVARDDSGARWEIETLVAASDVTTPESLAADPGGRLVEVRVRVTLLNSPASGHEIVELVTRLESPARTAQVVDYLPRTTMSTDIAGAMQAQRRDHSSRWLDFQLQGFAPLLAGGPARGSVRGAADTPQEWRVASGVSNGGFGAYFKLRGDARSTLEGGHEFTLVLRVPRAWRGDWLVVRCEAYAREPSFMPGGESRRLVASRRSPVVIYSSHDPGAREAAEARRKDLLATLAAHREAAPSSKSRPRPATR